MAANRVLTDARVRGGSALLPGLARLLRRFLKELGLQGVELSLTLVGDAEIREVNKAWRKKDKPTDVLSFPAGFQPVPEGVARPLGDIVISLQTARARAREDRRPLQDELARYLAHGLLHLLGHDHHQPRQARRMARAEAGLLGGAGMVAAALDAEKGLAKRPRRSPR